ncbi:MAG: GNAT family N-acetyltransferase [Kofleriaceae bacterium]
MTITRTTSLDPDFIALTLRLDGELRELYGEQQAAYASEPPGEQVPWGYDAYNKFVTETAVVAYRDGAPVGCGCFKELAGAARSVEIKRVYVGPEARGTGTGRAVVAALEAWARELGFPEIVLETGPLQTAAIALYESAGYQRIANYGPYAQLALSLCMRKPLTPADASR